MNGAQPSGYAQILLRVLALSGYGRWTRLGMALGMERSGRRGIRMPLILGSSSTRRALAGALPASG